MAPRRIRPITDAVALRCDGRAVTAQRDEPIAVALLAAGRTTLTRSVKYHRPRGPTCMAGRCDGCLMRVDGVPSVMTCRARAAPGRVVETQNVIGSAQLDLLEATDWFFPGGLDHHHMFTRFGPVNRAMQAVARRVAGIGRLPDRVAPVVPPERLDAEVLVVGAGVAGLEVATEAARRGMDVLLVDEEPQPGGLLVWQPRSAITDRHANGALAIVGELVARARAAGVRWLPNTCVVGVYDDVALCDAEDGPRLLRFRRIVVATGTHEGAVDAVDADAPAVFGTRAAARLLAYGVLVGDAVVVAGEGAWTRAVAEALRDAGARVEGPHALEALRAVRTRGGRVRGAVLELDGATRTVECDAVVVGPPPSAAYELAAQAGARVVFDGRRFVVQADDEGRTGIARLFAVGACTGRDTVEEALAQARRAATVLAEGGTT